MSAGCLKSIVVAAALLALPYSALAECTLGSGTWLDRDLQPVNQESVYQAIGSKSIVFLGEQHTRLDHHRWQAQVLAGIHAARSDVMLAMEMFPRRVQTVLDQWTSGNLSQGEFLEQAEWRHVWGYPADYYLPMLDFARINRVPLVALNVERSLITEVGEHGWNSVPTSRREGVTDPAPAVDNYTDYLAGIFSYKQGGHGQQSTPDLDSIRNSEDFQNFVAAQLTWDRAMAEAVAAAHRQNPDATIVAMVGRGHVEYGHGIPHQLKDLGINDFTVLLPGDIQDVCSEFPRGMADYHFVVANEIPLPVVPKPRLGVGIAGSDNGVMITEVVAGSVADQAGLLAGDQLVSIAGFELSTASEAVTVIQRTAPGSWLPVVVMRDGKPIDVIARFPRSFE